MGRMIRFFTILFLSCVACFAQVKQWHLTNTSANVQLQLDNRVMRVATLAALKALPAVQVASGALVSTAGYTTAGDGGGALYRYDSSSTAMANDGDVILPTHGTGRYLLQHSGEVNLRQFGARGDTSIGWIRNVSGAPTPTDDAPALQTAINFCGENGVKLFVPNGRYFVGTTVSNRSYTGVTIEGVTESLALTGQYTSNIVAQQTTFIRNGNYTMLLFAGALTAAEMTNNSYLFGLQRYAKVSNLLIQDANRGAVVTEPCVVMKRSMLSRWHNVEFSGIQSTALDLWTADDAIFTNCRWLACGVQQKSAVVIHRRETSGSEPEYEINNTLTFNSCNWEGAYWTQIEVPATGVGDATTVKFIGCTVKNADFAGSSIAPMISLTRANNFYFDNLEVVHDGTAITSPVTLNNIVFFDRCRLYGKLVLNQLGHNANVTIVNAARILDPRDSDLAIDVGSTAAATISGSEIISVSNTTANTSFNLSGRSFRNDGTVGGAYNNKPYSNWLQSAPTQVPFFADLLTVAAVREGLVVETMHYATAGDGGGGRYRWTATVGTTYTYGGRIAHSSGAWVLVDNPASFLQWGVVAGNPAAAASNATRMTEALRFMRDGGHLILPKGNATYYVGPTSVRPAVNLTNLIVELHGNIEVPATPVWDATHPSLFHFADTGIYNNLTIRGTASLFGNATNQTTSAGRNYGKQNCFWVGNATNLVVEGVTIRGFGFFAVMLTGVNGAKVAKLTIDQTHGNNDTLPTRWGANCDGVHVYESRDVQITGCDIQSTDDCVAFTVNVSNSTSFNYSVTDCILRPYAGSQFVPSAIRLGLETGVTNSTIKNVLIANNVIRPVGANGMYIGAMSPQVTRELTGIKIVDNVIENAAVDAIQIGPNAGASVTHNAIATGGIMVSHAHDVEVTGNRFQNIRAKAIGLANVGLATIQDNTISNVLDSTGGVAQRGVGIYFPHGLYGNNDDITISGNTFTGLDGGGIYSDGAVFSTSVLRVRDNVFTDWLRGLYASNGRTYPAIVASRVATSYISGNRFAQGRGSGIIISAVSPTAKHEISDNSFLESIAPVATVGGVEHVRVTYTTAGDIGVQATITGNRFGSYPGRAIVLENLQNTFVVGNSFFPDSLDATVSGEMVYSNYGTGTTGAATLMLANNAAHIISKGGASPSTFFRNYNNNGSGGSSVTLASVVANNAITPASGMAHFVDAFASGARELAYGATITIPNSAELPIRHRVTLTGNATLAWTSPSPGQRGTLDVYPDTVARVITLPSLAYSPTGSTITNSGGTASTNWTRLAWEVHQVGGTNRIFVQPTEVYR